MTEDIAEVATPPGAQSRNAEAPRCEVCGRQNETLRAAAYPWVASAVFMTVRRNLAGVWCSRHRSLRLAAAGLITSTIGWLGIPFGLLYTPMALLLLARGGHDLSEENAELLRRLARQRRACGHIGEALRCLEESLKLADSPEVRAEIAALQAEAPVSLEAPRSPAWPFLGLLLAMAAAGGASGLGISLLAAVLTKVGGSASSWAGGVGWLPLVPVGTLVALFLGQGVERVLERARCRERLLAYALAVLAALLGVYGLLEGRALGEAWTGWQMERAFSLAADGRVASLANWIRGGALVVWKTALSGRAPDLLYLALLAIAAVAWLAVGLSSARRTASWLDRVAEARREAVTGGGRVAAGWAALLVPVAVLALLAAAIPQRGIVDLPQAMNLAERGQELVWQGETERASGLLRKAVELEPELAPAHVALGWLLRQEEDFAAVAEFEAAVAYDPELADGFLGLGTVQSEAGIGDGGIGALERAVELDPSSWTAQHNLGWAYYRSGERFAEAAAAAEAAVLLAPDDPSSHYLAGESYYNLGQYDKAREAFLAVLRIDPERADAHDGLGWAYNFLKEYEDAQASFERALKLDPELADAHDGMGWAHYHREEYAAALQSFEQALELEPELAEAYVGVGWVRYNLGKPEQAIAAFETAIEKGPGLAEAYNGLGRAYLAQGDAEKAKASFDEAIRLDPQNASAYQGRGTAQMRRGMYVLAQQDMEEAVRLAPEDADAHLGLGWAYLYRDNLGEAIAELEAAAGMGADPGEAYYGLGEAYVRSRELDKAEEALQTGIEQVPNEGALHASLCFAYLQMGRTAEAVQAGEAAVRLLPGDGGALTHLALAHQASGEGERALVEAQQAVEAAPYYDLAHYALGLCYEEISPEKARAEYELFVALYEDRAYVDAYKERAGEYVRQAP